MSWTGGRHFALGGSRARQRTPGQGQGIEPLHRGSLLAHATIPHATAPHGIVQEHGASSGARNHLGMACIQPGTLKRVLPDPQTYMGSAIICTDRIRARDQLPSWKRRKAARRVPSPKAVLSALPTVDLSSLIHGCSVTTRWAKNFSS